MTHDHGFIRNSMSDRFHSSTALLFGCKGGPGLEAFPRLRNRYSNQAPTILQNRVVRKKKIREKNFERSYYQMITPYEIVKSVFCAYEGQKKVIFGVNDFSLESEIISRIMRIWPPTDGKSILQF